jgi:4-hydroxybutyryl-CoA dehydratase/vinylacetyl-CoA-Delta-isomerase
MALRTAQQYIDSLRDGRVVYFMGERIEDVTTHPILQICINWMTMDYIMQQDPKYQDLVTDLNEDGERVSFVFRQQKTRSDLMRLREIVKALGPGVLRQAFGSQVRRQRRSERRDGGGSAGRPRFGH